jgi:hypothetical protein
VTGNANLAGTSINIGNAAGDAFNTTTLTFNSAGSVSIAEDSDTTVTGANTAGAGLTLASAGALDNATNATIAVTGNASLAGTSINIGNASGDAFNTTTLTFNSAGAVSIAEDSATTVTGVNTATDLTLASLGALNNAAGASITATGLSTLSGTSITIGQAAGDTFNTGTLNFNSAGAVSIAEDSDTTVVGANTAGAGLTLASAGALDNADNATIAVTGNASLAGTSINIGNAAGDLFNTDTLTFNSVGSVSIAEDSATTVTGANTAGDLTLVSAAALDNAAGATIAVAGNSSLAGTSINIGNAAGDLFNTGTLTFNSTGAVNITEDSNMLVTGINTAGTLVLQTPADMDTVLGTTIMVTGTTVQLLAGGTIGGLEPGEVAKTTVSGIGYNAFGTITADNANIVVQAGGNTNGVSVDIVGSSIDGLLTLTPPNVPSGAVLFNGHSVTPSPFIKGMSPLAGTAVLAVSHQVRLTANGEMLPPVPVSTADVFMATAYPTESVSDQMTFGEGTVGMLSPMVKLQGLGMNVSDSLAGVFLRQEEELRKRRATQQ